MFFKNEELNFLTSLRELCCPQLKEVHILDAIWREFCSWYAVYYTRCFKPMVIKCHSYTRVFSDTVYLSMMSQSIVQKDVRTASWSITKNRPTVRCEHIWTINNFDEKLLMKNGEYLQSGWFKAHQEGCRNEGIDLRCWFGESCEVSLFTLNTLQRWVKAGKLHCAKIMTILSTQGNWGSFVF